MSIAVFSRDDVSAAKTAAEMAFGAKAFRGELPPQDPNDEPASVLLEREEKELERNNGKQLKAKKSKEVMKSPMRFEEESRKELRTGKKKEKDLELGM